MNKIIDWVVKLGGLAIVAGVFGFIITQLIVFIGLCRGG
jgi:hypothetical protein